jgi:FtsH-binding integral membrane protein
MKSLVDVLLVIVALAALAFAVYEFYAFVTGKDTGFTRNLLMAIIGFVVMCVCALAVFMRHSGAEEEIHITQ